MDARKRVSATIRDYIARERISREQFAFRTKLGKSTVDKLLIGIFSERTLAIVEGHTGLALRAMLDGAAAADRATEPANAFDRPSIAVLPFTNIGADASQEYFADGVVEDIITALSRVPRLLVIARNSTFTYKNRAVDIRQVGQELGVRYALEGSVRRAGERLRITDSWSMRVPGSTCGPIATKAGSMTCSTCRTASRRRSSGRSCPG